MNVIQASQNRTEIKSPATSISPLEGRKYTLIQPEDETQTGCWLTIGERYDIQAAADSSRHTILAEWKRRMGEYVLIGNMYIGRESHMGSNEEGAGWSDKGCESRIAAALATMLQGDRDFFSYVPWLLDAPIYIEIGSSVPDLRQTVYAGTPRRYISKRKPI